MKIAVDAMGGDYAPVEVIAGAIQWVQKHSDHIILVGQEEIIKKELVQYSYDSARVSIVNSREVIGMEESPAMAIRKKKDASIVVASKLVKEQLADAVVSCGSTGAQMAAALFILGRLEGIDRPPIGASLPNLTGGTTLLMDVGANVDCKPSQLLQFAVLGSAYTASVLGIDNPRISLLNNGEEETKGNSVSVETYELLKQHTGLNFIGNVEGRDLFSDRADVIICDGFTGNIVLKSIEGLALYIGQLIHREIGSLPKAFQRLDYTQVGGAPLLGVKGISVVCHGSSKRSSVYYGLKTAQECFNKKMVKMQEQKLKSLI